MPHRANEAGTLPVTIIGGYLGAGKTTLVNLLLRNAGGRRLAVLVNDFGDISIDADLIESADEQVLNLAGGCVCCSIGSDLVSTLRELRTRFSGIDHVLLETSGVAMPGVVAATVGLAPGIRRDGVIVVCDALHGPGWLADPYLTDTLQRQIGAADCLVISKQELAGPRASAQFASRLLELAASTPQLASDAPALPDILLGQLESLTTAPRDDLAHRPSPAPAPERVPNTPTDRRELSSQTFFTGQPVDPDALTDVLAEFPGVIFRAKGILTDRNGGQQLLQCVAGRSQVTEWPGDTDNAGNLVIIASLADAQRTKLETLLRNLGVYPISAPLTLNQTRNTGKIRTKG